MSAKSSNAPVLLDLRTAERFSNATTTVERILAHSGMHFGSGAPRDGQIGIGSGYFQVIVKSNGGSNGSATTAASWAYDLYDMADSGYVTKLNQSGTLQPTRSAARVGTNGSVTKATDGSVAQAYYDTTGAIKLWDCQELNPTLCGTGAACS